MVVVVVVVVVVIAVGAGLTLPFLLAPEAIIFRRPVGSQF
jgi:hypothetical protein